MYLLILTFFGLNQQYRIDLFSQIDEIVTYGNGYDWNTVYNFPIWLRNFTYKKIEERYRKKKEALEEQENVVTDTTKVSKIAKPNIQPINQYNAGISKK